MDEEAVGDGEPADPAKGGKGPPSAPGADVETSPVIAEAAAQLPRAKPDAPIRSSGDRSSVDTSIVKSADVGIMRAMQEHGLNDRMARQLGLVRSPLDEIALGRSLGVTWALSEAHKAMGLVGSLVSLQTQAARASAGIGALDSIDKIVRQQREFQHMVSGLGDLDSIFGRHSAMRDAVGALGGFEAIFKRHDALKHLASNTLASSLATTGAVWAVNQRVERAMRDLAGISSFTGLLGKGLLDRAGLEDLVSGTLAWQASSDTQSLSATLSLQLPGLVPERRLATAADFAGLNLSRLGERFVRDRRRLAHLQAEMLGLKRPWVDVDSPGQSVAAYVDARALATIVQEERPDSRAVVAAVREELGDYRDTDPVPEVIVANPVLRSAFRLEVGYNADLSSLPPAILAAVLGGFGGRAPRGTQADPEALESAVHQRARRLELKLRRFIEKKMMAKFGSRWSKQRVAGKTVKLWRGRRQTDLDNGRTPSRLFDYAGFEDYRAIIEQADNWAEVFEPIFKVKTSILETLRRLSLIRNPDAHYRIVTIEDFLDLHTEGGGWTHGWTQRADMHDRRHLVPKCRQTGIAVISFVAFISFDAISLLHSKEPDQWRR